MEIESRSFPRALLLAILVIAAVDVGVRVFEARLSGDIANTKGFPEQVARLSAAPGTQVVAIGNSLVGDGLDTGVFMSSWLGHDADAASAAIKLVPDASGIWDWHCIARYQLTSSANPPDLVIIGFGWNQLSDQARLSLTRAFNELCPAGAMRDFGNLSEQVTINAWLEMFAVKTSKLYAHREAIRHRVLQNVIPDYRRMTRRVNARAGQDEGEGGEPNMASSRISYAALAQMLDGFTAAGSQVVLVAMPVMSPYALDEEMCELLDGSAHRLLDLRYAVPSSETFYRDNLHLNDDGARLFSETLAVQLRSSRPSMSACAP